MTDLKNITLNGPSAEAAATVMDRFVLPKRMQAARLGVAYALAHDLTVTSSSTSGPPINNYEVHTIDDEGLLVDLVTMMRPLELETIGGPYRLIEALMNEGIREMARNIKSGNLSDIGDLLAMTEISEAVTE